MKGIVVKTLMLMRHGKSSWDEPKLSDHDRPLAKRGKRASKKIGALLVEQKKVPDLILTSSAKRARQTVKFLKKVSGFECKVKVVPELYTFRPDAYWQVIAQKGKVVERVMVVGHNPAMEEFQEQLSGEELVFPTAALVELELPIEQWGEIDKTVNAKQKNLWLPRNL